MFFDSVPIWSSEIVIIENTSNTDKNHDLETQETLGKRIDP